MNIGTLPLGAGNEERTPKVLHDVVSDSAASASETVAETLPSWCILVLSNNYSCFFVFGNETIENEHSGPIRWPTLCVNGRKKKSGHFLDIVWKSGHLRALLWKSGHFEN